MPLADIMGGIVPTAESTASLDRRRRRYKVHPGEGKGEVSTQGFGRRRQALFTGALPGL